MSIRQLTLKDIQDVDIGRVARAFDGHVARIANDCNDRPGDKKSRKVTLTVSCVPVIAADGSCEEVKTRISVKSSLPDHVTRELSMGLRKNGILVWNEDSPDAIDQTTMFEDDER